VSAVPETPSATGPGIPASTPEPSDSDWWETAVVYQIYPRSFADSGGDGIGDIPGVTSRVGYLAELGVDAVWLCPFYPSALADGGYDVDDYRDIDPRLGTLADFDTMVAALHGAGLKVLIDIVPNHSSNRHKWFVEALASPRGSAARARYIFRDGLPDGEVGLALPPNDWQSLFGGSAWEPVGDGQWYLHLFAAEQPDFNWDNEEVRADFQTTLRFWADRGVDGFRVDVAHGLVKNLAEPYPPWLDIAEFGRADGTHPWWDRDDLQHVYAEWRALFESYDPPRMAVAEAAVHPTRRGRYASKQSLGMAFNFEMQEADWRIDDYRRVINSGLVDVRDGHTATWLLGCHDSPRVASRYGLPLVRSAPPSGHSAHNDGSQAGRVVVPESERRVGTAIRNAQLLAREWIMTDGATPPMDRALGERRARAAALILFALPGSTYVFQGEELGLHEVPDLPREALQDPIAFRSGGREKGRDGCRVPLPWTADGESFGFGPGPAVPPQPPWFANHAVAVEAADPESTLRLYRAALVIRARLVRGPGFEWQGKQSGDVLHFVRPGGWHCVANFGPEPAELPRGEVLISSVPLESGRLAPDSTAWVLAND
jgi:alpha-glucosidase